MRHRETERETKRETERERESETHRERLRESETHRERLRESETQRDRETERETHTQSSETSSNMLIIELFFFSIIVCLYRLRSRTTPGHCDHCVWKVSLCYRDPKLSKLNKCLISWSRIAR